MFAKIKEWYGIRQTAKAIRDNPILNATLGNAAATLADKSAGLGKHLSDEEKNQALAEIAQEVVNIQVDPNPIQAARLKLGEWVCGAASCESLIVDRGTGWKALFEVPGITGELKNHLPSLAKANQDLKALAEAVGADTNPHALKDALMFRYWRTMLRMNAANTVRIGLGDRGKTQNQDWFKPFYISMVIFSESRYRGDLGLPSAFGDGDLLRALAHSTWINLIDAGEPDLRATWERQWEFDFHLGPSPYTGVDLGP